MTENSGIKYICQKCHVEEMIPTEVVEYFDMIDPERLLSGPAIFRCKKCGDGYMEPKHYEAKIMGFGLYEGLDYTIKPENKSED